MDEDVIRRKLLIDGDGTGDDRRLNLLIKAFFKWVSMEPSEESVLAYDRILTQLEQCEFVVKKSRQAAVMSSTEEQNYTNLSEDIKARIEEAKTNIASLKDDFHKAKTIRKNRMEYDILAKAIDQQPDRKETHKKLSQLSKDVDAVEVTGRKLATMLEVRKRQINMLWVSVHELYSMMDDADSEMMDDSLDTFDGDEVNDMLDIETKMEA